MRCPVRVLKAFRKLNDVRVRGRFKVRVHAMLSVIMLQARALAFPDQLRRCSGCGISKSLINLNTFISVVSASD